jgi:hypothetical protein
MAEWMLQDVADRAPHKQAPLLVRDEVSLTQALWRFARQEPRVVIVGISDSDSLQVGIGGEWAFVEHVVEQPWKAEVAIPKDEASDGPKPESVWFPVGGDSSEIPAEYLMPVAKAIELIAEYYRTGALPRDVGWLLA